MFGSNECLKWRCTTTWHRELSPSCQRVYVLHTSFKESCHLKDSRKQCWVEPVIVDSWHVVTFFFLFFWLCVASFWQRFPMRQMKNKFLVCASLHPPLVLFFHHILLHLRNTVTGKWIVSCVSSSVHIVDRQREGRQSQQRRRSTTFSHSG